MTDTTINVVLFGLSLLVPNTDLPPTGVTALMPDSTVQQVSSDGCRIPFHQPVALVKGAKFVESPLDGPRSLASNLLKRDRFDGGWSLRGLEVRLKLLERDEAYPDECRYKSGAASSGPFEMNPRDADDDGVWPTRANVGKVGWLWKGSAKLQRNGVGVECLTGAPEACPVAARLIVRDGVFQVCRLAAVQVGDHNLPPEEREYLQGFQSQEQGDDATRLGRSRPLPIAVRVSIQPTKRSVLVLMVKKLGERDGKEFLRFCPTSGADQIWIGNTPLDNHPFQSGYCSTHDVDRHFELFYLLMAPDELATQPALAIDREVPKATGRRTAKQHEVLQPEKECIVPALFRDGMGHVPELTAVCGKGQGKPNWAAGRELER